MYHVASRVLTRIVARRASCQHERMPNPSPTHCVAVIGGATAGAEVANRLAERNVLVVVFEQNPRPYGKIEDGLPRWHVALAQQGVRDDRREALAPRRALRAQHADRPGHRLRGARERLGLHRGRARQRRLARPPAADRGRGRLRRQGPHLPEPVRHLRSTTPNEADYDGPRFEILDDALVVGGGLASIDVAKILMLELTRAEARRARHRVRHRRARGEGHPEVARSARPRRSRTSASRAARSSTGGASRTCR